MSKKYQIYCVWAIRVPSGFNVCQAFHSFHFLYSCHSFTSVDGLTWVCSSQKQIMPNVFLKWIISPEYHRHVPYYCCCTCKDCPVLFLFHGILVLSILYLQHTFQFTTIFFFRLWLCIAIYIFMLWFSIPFLSIAQKKDEFPFKVSSSCFLREVAFWLSLGIWDTVCC